MAAGFPDIASEASRAQVEALGVWVRLVPDNPSKESRPILAVMMIGRSGVQDAADTLETDNVVLKDRIIDGDSAYRVVAVERHNGKRTLRLTRAAVPTEDDRIH